MEWFLAHYVGSVGDLDAGDPRLSPLLGDLAGVSRRRVVVTAELDPLRDEGRRTPRSSRPRASPSSR